MRYEYIIGIGIAFLVMVGIIMGFTTITRMYDISPDVMDIITGNLTECNQTEPLPIGTEFYCQHNNVSYYCKVSDQPDPHIRGWAFCEPVVFN